MYAPFQTIIMQNVYPISDSQVGLKTIIKRAAAYTDMVIWGEDTRACLLPGLTGILTWVEWELWKVWELVWAQFVSVKRE